MRCPPSSTKARGVTLIEAMVSLAILLVGILGLMHMHVFAVTSDQGARAKGRAQDLASPKR